MDINLENPFQSFFSQLFPFLLSLCDDALVLGLSRIGLEIHWLNWLSQVILGCTILYWVVKLWRNRHWFGKLFGRATIAQQKARVI
jgi:hypothetical protein